uniref:Uncharacterized protein n=3 Tax=Meloidogyne TaxID=189290 RepID=A0A6V7UJ77_MELEN|nr:unnamed protein product [Meloidogyne enterolobii]
MASATTSRGDDAPLAVMQDTGTKVIMTIMVPGMKKRGGLLLTLKRWLHIKSKDPFALASNVKFGQYSLTEQSMSLLMEVYRDKSAMSKRSEDCKRFVVSIGRFPTQINPNSVGYNIQQRGDNSYIVMTICKVDNFSTNWKDFLSVNGTLDLATL